MGPRFRLWSCFEQILALLTVGLLFGVPVSSKVWGPYPPAWFASKFDGTIIDMFPGSLGLAFTIIVVAEVVIPILCLVAFVRGEPFKPAADPGDAPRVADYALAGSCLLLLALTFGSLVAKDYDNAFHDFGYLVGVVYLRNRAFPTGDASV